MQFVERLHFYMLLRRLRNGTYQGNSIALSAMGLSMQNVKELITAIKSHPTTLSQITKLNLSNNSVIQFVFEDLPALEEIDISESQASSLILRNLPKLNKVNARNNQLSEVRFVRVNLVEADFSSNVIPAIDLSKQTRLETLDVSFNFLKSIDLTANTKLQTADISDNHDLKKVLFSQIGQQIAYSSNRFAAPTAIVFKKNQIKYPDKFRNYSTNPLDLERLKLKYEQIADYMFSVIQAYKRTVANEHMLYCSRLYYYLATHSKEFFSLQRQESLPSEVCANIAAIAFKDLALSHFCAILDNLKRNGDREIAGAQEIDSYIQMFLLDCVKDLQNRALNKLVSNKTIAAKIAKFYTERGLEYAQLNLSLGSINQPNSNHAGEASSPSSSEAAPNCTAYVARNLTWMADKFRTVFKSSCFAAEIETNSTLEISRARLV